MQHFCYWWNFSAFVTYLLISISYGIFCVNVYMKFSKMLEINETILNRGKNVIAFSKWINVVKEFYEL